MAGKLKVYGWSAFRREAAGPHHQTREIVAAASKAAAARAAGYKRPAQMNNLCETGNAQEIEIATAQPGTVFWRSISMRDAYRAAGGTP